MSNLEKCCSTCAWHQLDDDGEDYMCKNPDSDYVADYTDANHVCVDWEED